MTNSKFCKEIKGYIMTIIVSLLQQSSARSRIYIVLEIKIKKQRFPTYIYGILNTIRR